MPCETNENVRIRNHDIRFRKLLARRSEQSHHRPFHVRSYKHIIKPHFIFNQTPDVAHSQMIDFCKVTRNIPPLMWLCREMLDYTDPILETNVMGVDFANPFGLSAGLDKDCEMPVLLDVGFGFETVGSTHVAPLPRQPAPMVPPPA